MGERINFHEVQPGEVVTVWTLKHSSHKGQSYTGHARIDGGAVLVMHTGYSDEIGNVFVQRSEVDKIEREAVCMFCDEVLDPIVGGDEDGTLATRSENDPNCRANDGQGHDVL